MTSPPTAAAAAQTRWAGRTDAGPRRENNEDNFGVFVARTGQSLDRAQGEAASGVDTGVLLVLSDGVGGHNAGEVASQITVESFAQSLSRALRNGVPRRNEVRANLLREAARQANGAVRQAAAANDRQQGMAATLSAAWLIGRHYYLVQVGDSRTYRLRDGHLEQLSCDQSEIGRQVFEGQITEEQARKMPGRNVIECAVGEPPERFKPEVDWGEVHSGDLFLLCSDGLSDGLTSAQLEELVQQAPGAKGLGPLADHLLQTAITAYGRDNVTVLLGQVSLAGLPLATPVVVEKRILGFPTWTWAVVAVMVILALVTWLVYLPALDERDRARNVADGLQTELEAAERSMVRIDGERRQAQDAKAAERENLAARELELQVLTDERDKLREAVRNLNERITELDTAGGEALLQAEARAIELAEALDEVSRRLMEKGIEYDLLLEQQQRAALTQPMPPARTPARPSGPRR